jgi:hypothetical protein
MTEMPEKDERKFDFSLDDIHGDEHRETWLNSDSGEVHIDTKQSSGRPWASLAVLAVALLVVAGVGYTALKRNSAQFARFSGLMDSLAAMRQHVSGIENRLNAWKGEHQALVERMKKLDDEFRSGLLQARKQTQAMILEAEDRLQQELDQRTQVLAARLAQTEAAQQNDRARMAKLESEVASAHQELAAFRQAHQQQLASLRRQEAADHNELASIDHMLQTDQVSFEAEKNRNEDIVPGVSLRVTGTNVQYQRFSGYIWFGPDRRTIWIRGQGADRPVVFYSRGNNQAYELVVTRVNRNGTVGYLLLPAGAETTTSASLLKGNHGPANAEPRF